MYIVSCGCIEPPKNEINHKVPKTNLGYFLMTATIPPLRTKNPIRNLEAGSRGSYKADVGHGKRSSHSEGRLIRCDSKLGAIYEKKELELEYFDSYIKTNVKKMKTGNK